MLAAIAALSAGCTNARISQGFTSGAVGCPRGEITIYNETASGPMGSMHAWEAECRGKHFVCSYHETSGVRCSEALAGAPDPKFPDSPKDLRARVAEFNEFEGAMSPASQDDAMMWLERNQAATDDEAVSAMIDLCDLMSHRGSKPFAARLEAIERNAANKDVRSECAEAREEAEERD
ncbi:MAG: hypothetical protein EOP90_07425 [Lysobacteraceae bacterium]|nr:MAG: hypothetical protein EOP90_07425 [Xanthomonadaceae bacterium]